MQATASTTPGSAYGISTAMWVARPSQPRCQPIEVGERHREQHQRRRGAERQQGRVGERAPRHVLAQQDLGEIGEGGGLRRQADAEGRHQGGRDQRYERQHHHQQDEQPGARLHPAAQTPETPAHRRPVSLRGDVAPAQQPALHQHACEGDRGDQHRQHRDLGDHGRPKTRQTLVDQDRQQRVRRRDAEQRRDAEIADRGDEGERAAGDQRGPEQRQDDPQAACAGLAPNT